MNSGRDLISNCILYHIWGALYETGIYAICGQFISGSAFVPTQSNQKLHGPLICSWHFLLYLSEQYGTWSTTKIRNIRWYINDIVFYIEADRTASDLELLYKRHYAILSTRWVILILIKIWRYRIRLSVSVSMFCPFVKNVNNIF